MTYMPARQARKHLNHYHSATKRHLRKEKSESVRGLPRMHTILRHDGDDPLVISSLIGPVESTTGAVAVGCEAVLFPTAFAYAGVAIRAIVPFPVAAHQ